MRNFGHLFRFQTLEKLACPAALEQRIAGFDAQEESIARGAGELGERFVVRRGFGGGGGRRALGGGLPAQQADLLLQGLDLKNMAQGGAPFGGGAIERERGKDAGLACGAEGIRFGWRFLNEEFQ